MDPLTQGVLGAVASQSAASKEKMGLALLAGVAGGMAADLDVFIRSDTDPLLFLEYHRHFTHALVFIPIGGAIVGFLLWALLRYVFKKKLKLKDAIGFAILGYATHGLLDACTSYGTQLLWPFTNDRIAWNSVGIIDPVPTLVWLVAAGLAFRNGNKTLARIGLVLGICYLGLGAMQRERAESVQQELIQSRGHVALKSSMKPTVLNIFLWRSIYETDGRFYTDAIRVGAISENRTYQGESVEKFKIESLNIPQGSVLFRDIARFDWFSDGWVSIHPDVRDEKMVLGDIRYSLLPNDIHPLWGIKFDPQNTDQHVIYDTFRTTTDRASGDFFKMIMGRDLEKQN